MLRKAFLYSLCSVAAIGGGVASIAYAGSEPDASLRAALATRLPKTPLTAVDCAKIAGLCEVQAGSQLFYTDRAGRFLVIGRVYDMETRQDLTAARLLEISPGILVGGAASPALAEEEAEAVASPARTTQFAQGRSLTKADLDGLPASGAIKWGTGQQTVTVFSDFRCGYCNRLHQTLADMNVKVIERPISILGTRPISDAVICAKDPAKALFKAYNSEPIDPPRKCDTSGLTANEAFARAHGFTGTPVIVRSDGAVVQGYRPREFLESWLKGAS